MQSKLSKLQKMILSYIYNNQDKMTEFGLYKHVGSSWFYTIMKYDIANECGKLIPSKRERTVIKGSSKKWALYKNVRVKESFHPVFKNSMNSLVKRKLINDSWKPKLTSEGIEICLKIGSKK